MVKEKQGSLLFSKLHIIIFKVALFIGLPFYGFMQEPENLVLNPSFEEHYSCHPGPNNLDSVKYWSNLFNVGSPGFFRIVEIQILT